MEAEGAARDMIRMLQQTRRTLDLNVSDRVTVGIDGPTELLAQLSAHGEMIAGEVLATSVTFGPGTGQPQHAETVDGAEVRVGWRLRPRLLAPTVRRR